MSDVLLGRKIKRVRELEHDELTVFGIVDDYDRTSLRLIADGLVERGLLARADGQYPTLGLTKTGREWLRGQDVLMLQLRVQETTPRKERAHAPRVESQDRLDTDLFDRLRAVRRRLANDENVPAFVVFNDATLRGLAEAKPVTPQDMLRVSGVGPAKLQRYGETFLAVIQRHADGEGSATAVGPAEEPDLEKANFVSADRLAEIRKTHPRAYEPWTEMEERELERLQAARLISLQHRRIGGPLGTSAWCNPIPPQAVGDISRRLITPDHL